MATLYVVPNWEKDFENHRSRCIEKTSFYCCGNHFDGIKIRRLGKLPNSTELYGAFHAILGVASRCDRRGVLMGNNGPLSAIDLADKTVFPPEPFEAALKTLARKEVGLLESYEIRMGPAGWELPPSILEQFPDASDRNETKESNARKGRHRGGDPQPKTPPNDPERRHGGDLTPETPPNVNNGRSETENATTVALNADSRQERKKEGNGKKEGKEVPPPLADDLVPRDSVIERLGTLARLVFDEKKWRPNLWSMRRMTWLDEALDADGCFPEKDLALLEWFYHLPNDDPFVVVAGFRRRSFDTLLENLQSEVQKICSAKKEVADVEEEKPPGRLKEPPGWEKAFDRLFKDRRRPASFWTLHQDERDAVSDHLNGKAAK